MDRAPGLSVRLKLTLSYAGFLMLAGALLLAAVWVFLLRYVPERALISTPIVHGVFPIRSNLLHVFAPRAAAVLAFLLVFGLLGGWLLAGRMLAPLARITDATRIAATGSLSHRIRLQGRKDEFRELADAFDTMLARLEANNQHAHSRDATRRHISPAYRKPHTCWQDEAGLTGGTSYRRAARTFKSPLRHEELLPSPTAWKGGAEQFFDFPVHNSALAGEGEPEARVKLPAFVGSGYVSQQTGKPSVAQQDRPDHCGGQDGGRVPGSVSGEDPVCLRQVRLGLSGIRDEQARIKPSVYRRDMALQPSLGVGCEPPRFYNRRRVRIDALVQAQQRVDGLVDVVRVEHAAEPHVERGQDTRLSDGKRARVFDVAGVIGPVDAAVVVMQSAIGTFSCGALHDVAAQGTYDQAAQGVPGRGVLSPSADGGGRFFALCGLPFLTGDEGGDGALDDDPGRLVGRDEFRHEPRRGVVAVVEPLDLSILAIGVVASVSRVAHDGKDGTCAPRPPGAVGVALAVVGARAGYMELVEPCSDTRRSRLPVARHEKICCTHGAVSGSTSSRCSSAPQRAFSGLGWGRPVDTSRYPYGGRPPWKRPVVACCSFAARTRVWSRRRSALDRPPKRFSTMSWASLFGSTGPPTSGHHKVAPASASWGSISCTCIADPKAR